MKILFKYFEGNIKEAILAPLLKLLEAVFELAVPLILAIIIDDIIPSKNNNLLLLMIIILFLLAFFNILVAVIAQYYSSKVATHYSKNLSAALFEKILALSYTESSISSGELISRLLNDTLYIQIGINLFLRLFLRAPVIIIGSLMLAFSMNRMIAFEFLIMLLGLLFIIFLISRFLVPIYQKVKSTLDRMTSLITEQVTGMRIIRSYHKTDKELHFFKNQTDENFQQQIKATYLTSLLNPLTFTIINITLIIIIWQGHLAILSNQLSVGIVVALINYLLQILIETVKLTTLVSAVNQSFVSSRRLLDLLNLEERNNKSLDDLLSPKADENSLIVNAVSYSYPNSQKMAINKIQFSLKPHETLGIIGGTSSGKSTLLHLLAGLLRPSQGQVGLYYQNKTPKTLEEFSKWVSLSPQVPQLFEGSIRDNLELGHTSPLKDEELWQALTIAQAREFIEKKPLKLDSSVEQYGHNYSGGQKQRLTLARSLVSRKPFLFLDNPTSSLDYLTEKKVLDALHHLSFVQNMIIVSQHYHVISRCHKILVLDNGNQVGFGSHEELLEKNPYYQAIYQTQKKGGEYNEKDYN
ncbi:ABC transporter ATP-binding protein [Streptococcus zalophi]|uniref:ABC transporter ATP-binding protein n=1 Tax=Streptococcus zalophi TaxID=640031 RepID=UPI00215C186D|nr:ABC transporter ATP-binding protein [Streptococcus zalophi]MCR8967364.1 ABC transporter ATP-binding protein/permease [Streptococcus zalophi]